MSKTEKKRTINFSNDEKRILSEFVLKYRDVVENKRTDASTNILKYKGWVRIAEDFNNVSTYCHRTPSSLKTCWENIKRQRKKVMADQKKEIFMTGGGKPSQMPSSSGADTIVEAVLGPALESLSNKYDSDAFHCDAPEDSEEIQYVVSISEDVEINDENSEFETTSETPATKNDSSIQFGIQSDNKVSIQKPSGMQKSSTPKQIPNDNDTDMLAFNETPSVSQEKVTPLQGRDANWEKWSPALLKHPITDALKIGKESVANNNSWLKRRRPYSENLPDQLYKKKIALVDKLIQNAHEEGKLKLLILEEQLKQEKIKTENMKAGSHK